MTPEVVGIASGIIATEIFCLTLCCIVPTALAMLGLTYNYAKNIDI